MSKASRSIITEDEIAQIMGFDEETGDDWCPCEHSCHCGGNIKAITEVVNKKFKDTWMERKRFTEALLTQVRDRVDHPETWAEARDVLDVALKVLEH